MKLASLPALRSGIASDLCGDVKPLGCHAFIDNSDEHGSLSLGDPLTFRSVI